MSERFEHHARTVSLLTLLSRITGLVREACISRIFGAGAVTDAFFFAFMIPNLFRRLFGEGALSAAFLPVYAQIHRDDPPLARRLASLTIALLLIVLGALVLAGEGVLFVVSSRCDHSNLAVWLTMVMLPYMPLVCVVAILGAMLQVHGWFGPTAAAPIVLNLCIITAALGLAAALEHEPADTHDDQRRLLHVGAVAGSVVFAGMLQVLWSLWALRRHPWWTTSLRPALEPMKQVIRRAGPMILGLGVLQLNTLLDGVIASYPTAIGPTIAGYDYPLQEGAMAAVSFAQRLYQFPVGVFGIAVATAIFPALARLADDETGFRDIIRRGLRLVVFIGLPAGIGLMLVRTPLTAVVLQGGDFTTSDTGRVAFVLLGYGPAVCAYSMTHVLTRAFFAKGDVLTPVKVSLLIVFINLALNCTLIWTPLREAGLAWATSICALLQITLLSLLLRRRIGPMLNRAIGMSWLKSIVATLVMIGSVLAMSMLVSPSTERWSSALATLALLVVTGGIGYVIAALALRMPELRWATGRST